MNSIEMSEMKSFSRPVSLLAQIFTSAEKSLRIGFRYIPNLAGKIVQLVFRGGFLLLLSRTLMTQGGSLSAQLTTEKEMSLFFLSSMLLLVLRDPTLWAPLQTVNEDLYNGTLEYLYSHPGSRYGYYVGTILSSLLFSLIAFLPIYGFMVFYSQAGLLNLIMVLLVCCITGLGLSAFGIMIAVLGLLWRQVHSLAQLIGLLFEFLGGAYIPVESFPAAIRFAAYSLPYTWGYDLIRYYVLQRKWDTLLSVQAEWMLLVLFGVFYTICAAFLLRKAESLSKKGGLSRI